MRSLVVCLALTGAAAPAVADVVAAVEIEAHVEVAARVEVAAPIVDAPRPAGLEERSPLTRGHWELGLAMLLPIDHGDPGAHAVLGRQLGPVRLGLEYSLGSACADQTYVDKATGAIMTEAADAQLHRIGAAARYRVGVGMDDVGAGLYLEAGVGRQQLRFDRGPAAVRDDVLIGIGMDVLGGGRQLVGLDIGGRFTLASGSSDAAPAEVTAALVVGLLLGT